MTGEVKKRDRLRRLFFNPLGFPGRRWPGPAPAGSWTTSRWGTGQTTQSHCCTWGTQKRRGWEKLTENNLDSETNDHRGGRRSVGALRLCIGLLEYRIGGPGGVGVAGRAVTRCARPMSTLPAATLASAREIN